MAEDAAFTELDAELKANSSPVVLPTEASVEYIADAPWTDDEKHKVAAMRAALVSDFKGVNERDSYWTSDHVMHRILVARSSNMDAALGMWRHIVAFRAARKCWTLLDGYPAYREPEVMRRYFPWGFGGTDKDGFPLLIERIGNVDLIGIGQALAGADGKYQRFLDWVAWYHEVQEKLMRGCTASAGGRDRHKMTVVIDLSGLSLRHCSTATLTVLKRRTRLEEEHYPEVVRRVMLINTPSMFASVWGVVKRFVDPGTAAKFQIIGYDCLPTILKYVNADSVPAYLGGKLVDEAGDTYCTRMVCAGGVIPLAYLHECVGGDGRGAGEEVSIPAGKCSDVILRVPPGSTVRWGWAAESNDAAFSVRIAPAGAAAAAAVDSGAGVITVSASVCGAHILAAGFDRENAPNPFPVPSASTVAPSTDAGLAPGLVLPAGCKASDVVPPARVTTHASTWTCPASGPHYVRLRWDNGFSWMSGKTIARRVDVICEGDEESDARERAEGAPPRGAAGSIARAHDGGDEAARARAEHRDRVVERAGKAMSAEEADFVAFPRPFRHLSSLCVGSTSKVAHTHTPLPARSTVVRVSETADFSSYRSRGTMLSSFALPTSAVYALPPIVKVRADDPVMQRLLVFGELERVEQAVESATTMSTPRVLLGCDADSRRKLRPGMMRGFKLHVDAPAVEVFEGGHSVHTDAPPVEKVPSSHCLQDKSTFGVSAKVPAGQGVQISVVASAADVS